MLDKRVQWLSGYGYILCEEVFEADNLTPFPDYFEYTVYDKNLREVDGWEITWDNAVKYIFPHMDTDDIPYFETLKKQWIDYYNIDVAAENEYEAIMERPILSVQAVSRSAIPTA